MELINRINDIYWGWFLIAALILCAIWFTVKTRGVQFSMIKEMFRLLGESTAVSDSSDGKNAKHISSFQAFAISIAGRVGTGNLAGVACAIAVGGPGAVFWMWIMALLGSATSFVESTLAQLFKLKTKHSFIGGPAYYMEKGLGARWMGIIFAVLMIFTFGFSNNGIQSNTICAAMEGAFGFKPWIVGICITLVTVLIIFGGVRSIAKVSSVLVPFMAIAFILLSVIVIAMNIKAVPSAFKMIIDGAFGFRQAAGGFVGAAMMQGIKRGLFSNEAGEGSSPNAAATAWTSHPVKQGLIQALGVFTDTLLICSCTAFIILCSGVPMVGESEGVKLTQDALSAQIGPSGSVFVAIAIFFFAFSTILGNYYYGEANIRFIFNVKKDNGLTSLTKAGKYMLLLYRLLVAVVIMLGSCATLSTLWALNDIFMAMMTTCNLIAIVILGRYAFRLLADYKAQKKAGIKDPTFHKSLFPELEDKIDAWD